MSDLTIQTGATVAHTVPEMLYGRSGRVMGHAGTKYGVHYWWVRYTDRRGLTRQTAFSAAVLQVLGGEGQ